MMSKLVLPGFVDGARRPHQKHFASVTPNQLITFAMASRAG
jgi:hypothetical protein